MGVVGKKKEIRRKKNEKQEKQEEEECGYEKRETRPNEELSFP